MEHRIVPNEVRIDYLSKDAKENCTTFFFLLPSYFKSRAKHILEKDIYI